ncbi:hypothetical protein H0X32_01395 [Patescibacteria group bacterium]|nr:hypothetical protein [Patescibacteria group bacterium]
MTPEKVADDFNRYLARKHASAGQAHISYKLNFAQLTTEINTFRITNYQNVSARELPEVTDIEKAVRAKLGLKAQGTRSKKTSETCCGRADETRRAAARSLLKTHV